MDEASQRASGRAAIDRIREGWHSLSVSRFAIVLGLSLMAAGCGPTADNGVIGTVDLGDNFVAPDLSLDEDFFVCQIQPLVLTEFSCATGIDSDSGGCHDSRSALRLLDADSPPPCDDDGAIVDVVPDSYAQNFEAVAFSVQSDPLSSPLYLRPLNRASHPRQIFDEDDPAAELILDWISAGTR